MLIVIAMAIILYYVMVVSGFYLAYAIRNLSFVKKWLAQIGMIVFIGCTYVLAIFIAEAMSSEAFFDNWTLYPQLLGLSNTVLALYFVLKYFTVFGREERAMWDNTESYFEFLEKNRQDDDNNKKK